MATVHRENQPSFPGDDARAGSSLYEVESCFELFLVVAAALVWDELYLLDEFCCWLLVTYLLVELQNFSVLGGCIFCIIIWTKRVWVPFEFQFWPRLVVSIVIVVSRNGVGFTWNPISRLLLGFGSKCVICYIIVK